MRTIAKVRYTAALMGFALCISSVGIVDAANFAGTWTFSAVMANATSAPVCVFRQAGNRISGSCKGPNGIGSAIGAVSGDAIAFQWHIIATNPRGLAGIATYKGVWGSDGVVRGRWTHSAIPREVGTFTGQKLQ
jgi:hypothetical protein